jgi:hypothetical protein
MIEVDTTTEATPAAVMAVLADGWLFALWVVGASHIREVDAGWPAPGRRIHHSVGAWPALISDTTEVISYDPAGSLELLARGWPIGEAKVRVDVRPEAYGSRIVLAETVVSGPGQLIRPLERLLIPPRNRESLRRLVAIAEGRKQQQNTDVPSAHSGRPKVTRCTARTAPR